MGEYCVPSCLGEKHASFRDGGGFDADGVGAGAEAAVDGAN